MILLATPPTPITAPLLGWLLGALIPIEPDHLCSLIALNAGTRKPGPAFVSGMTWGLGHSVGMLVFCVVVLPLVSIMHVDVWEYYGNYVAGGLLICIGIYFLVNELKYLEARDDGSWAPKQDACGCCHEPVYIPRCSRDSSHRADDDSCSKDGCCDGCDPESEQAPLLRTQEKACASEPPKTHAWEDFKCALVGMLQGLCCPSCIAGLAFVGQMGAQHHTGVDVALFFGVCFTSVVLCSGMISALCVLFSGYCGTYLSLSPRSLFRIACFFSMAVGTAWIILNYLGKLRVIEYTHSLEHHLMAKNGQVPEAMMMSEMTE